MTDNTELVEAPCTELADQGEPITFTVIAELTGISRTTLYHNQQLRAIVEDRRSHTHDRRTLTGLSAEIAHLRTGLEAIADRVRQQEERLRRLESRQPAAWPTDVTDPRFPTRELTSARVQIGRLKPRQRPCRVVLRHAEDRGHLPDRAPHPGPSTTKDRDLGRPLQRGPATQPLRLDSPLHLRDTDHPSGPRRVTPALHDPRGNSSRVRDDAMGWVMCCNEAGPSRDRGHRK